MDRAEVEHAIQDEEVALEQVARLFETRRNLQSWPDALRDALGLAMEDEGVSRAEGWKVVALRRHIFGAAGTIPVGVVVPQTPSMTDRRRAERLRSGLTARVRYRAGSYLNATPP